MSADSADRRNLSLVPEQAGRIDSLCDRFESAWLAGSPPRIEEFLLQVEDTDRPALLRELLNLELHFRAHHGGPGTAEEYRERFAAYGSVIDGVFVSFPTSPGTTPGQGDSGAPNTSAARHPATAADSVVPAIAAAPGEPQRPTVPGYEILGELGRGGMGVVYKAKHLKLGRVVALKMILSGAHASPQALARFQLEARAVAMLQHRGIVQVFDVGDHEGLPFFSLEFVEGGSLADRIRGNPWPPARAAEVVILLARALDEAHRHGIVHRDLKPGNVLLGKDGAPKITDFGLAKNLQADSGQTASGAIVGTPSYMAPEQALGETRQIGPLSDVYGLGAILYELLTGRPPFRGATVMDTVYQVTTADPVSPKLLQPKLAVDLETICLKALQKEPGRRYATAEALAEDLGRQQAGEPIAARPVSLPTQLVKWARRRPAQALAVAVTAMAAAVLLVGGLVFTSKLNTAWGEERKRAGELAQTAAKLSDALKLATDKTAVAEEQTKAAKKELLRAESLIYCGQTNKGQEQLESNDLVGCRLTLDDTRWDLRGPEYGYLANQLQRRARTLFGHTDVVASLALSVDGKRLFSGSWDQTIKVWDLETGKETSTLRGHTDRVTSLALSGDGKRLFSGSWDETIKVWDLEAGKEISTLRGHTREVTSLALSVDGKRLFSGSRDETIKVWPLEALLPAAKR